MEGESWIRELTLSQCRIRRSILEGLSRVGFDFVRDKAFRRRKNAAEAGSCCAFRRSCAPRPSRPIEHPGQKFGDTIPTSYIFYVRTPGPNSELSRMNGGPQHMSKRARQSTYLCRPDDKQESSAVVTKEIF